MTTKPYRKHRWETIPAWPQQYLPDHASGMPRYPAYDCCKDCCVTRLPSTEQDWCGNPRDANYEPYVLATGEAGARPVCILNLDSPSYPPEEDEYRQCGCAFCRKHLQEAGARLPQLKEDK